MGNFQAHQKIHSGIRDHVCPICQRGFYTGGDLTKHMVTHTGIKNFHCDICGKSFSRGRDMQAHKRKMHNVNQNNASQVVSEEEEDEDVVASVVDTVVDAGNIIIDSFKCPDCNKEFDSAGSLSVHFRSHSSNNFLNLPLGSSSHAHMHTSHYHAGAPLNHHLTPMQTNTSMAMTMAHMLPPPPPPSGHIAPPSMMQRIHPY